MNVRSERQLAPGVCSTRCFSVTESETARFIGGDVRALSTPVLMYWTELVASDLIRKESGNRYGSVGVRVDVRHIAAAHPGDRVAVTVRVASVVLQMARFTVSVTDEATSVVLMEGEHDRALVRQDADRHR